MSNGGTVVEFTAGMKVGPDERYEIVRICGRGGMGVVYEAVDHGLDRPRKVALKQLNKVFASSSWFELFKRLFSRSSQYIVLQIVS